MSNRRESAWQGLMSTALSVVGDGRMMRPCRELFSKPACGMKRAQTICAAVPSALTRMAPSFCIHSSHFCVTCEQLRVHEKMQHSSYHFRGPLECKRHASITVPIMLWHFGNAVAILGGENELRTGKDRQACHTLVHDDTASAIFAAENVVVLSKDI